MEFIEDKIFFFFNLFLWKEVTSINKLMFCGGVFVFFLILYSPCKDFVYPLLKIIQNCISTMGYFRRPKKYLMSSDLVRVFPACIDYITLHCISALSVH